MGTWSGSGGTRRHVRSSSLGKRVGPKQTRIPKTQLVGAGAGCALARAPVRSAISWALLRRSTRHRPAWLRPPAAAGQSRAGPREPPRGGDRAAPAAAAAGAEPAAAASASSLRARPGSPAAAGWEDLAPRLGQQQVGSWSSGLLRLPNCNLALGKSFLPFSEPHTSLFLSSVATVLCVLLEGPARLQVLGRNVCKPGEGGIASQPGRVPLSPPSHPGPLAPRMLRRACGVLRSSELNGGPGTRAQNSAGFRRAPVLQPHSRWAISPPRLLENYLQSAGTSLKGEQLVPSRIVLPQSLSPPPPGTLC